MFNWYFSPCGRKKNIQATTRAENLFDTHVVQKFHISYEIGYFLHFLHNILFYKYLEFITIFFRVVVTFQGPELTTNYAIYKNNVT